MATNNYAGNIFTMESFTAQTTDGSGDIVVVLQNTPIGDESIIVQLSGVGGAFAEFQTRTGTSLTVRCYQKYDKATDVDGTASQITDLPSGVTETNTNYTVTSATTGAGGTDGNNSGTGAVLPNHTHTVTPAKMHTHGHSTINSSATALSTLNSTGSLTITVAYAF